ncbi:1-acyl-sn-glycerol-3-phosphate acyltransferase [Alphaproteobacteria bacterium KMM 3653]|uniref:Glycerol-3-phosphate acyltransferase n=1 Tax=Harenicola maris TaxID=2841044 RepID=A0AAP2CQN3_9RHOB|nr:1-acyl-sn-glycerol-3-phosphate acyltransferase [Harenicola maris]
MYIPVWAFIILIGFALWAALDRVLLPSVRWFFRRRLERAVEQLNERLPLKIQPFKLARRYDMVQRLIYDPEVLDAVVQHAAEEGVPESVAFERARRYARETVPAFSAAAYFGVGTRGARWLARGLYRVRVGYVDQDGLSKLDPEATVIFVMNHRSNMDYVLVTYLVSSRSALSYAVGEWARGWPLRVLIRSMGAYFIRRKSRNALYRKVLARYVQLATKGGVTQAMFPEGGLSLDGKLAPPKMGLLNYIAEADVGERPVVFVPVALSYDRVLEDRILIEASQAGTRRFRARLSVVGGFVLRQMWLRLRGKFYRFGYASVSFGEPLSRDGYEANTKGLAKELMTRIARVMPVLPVPLVAEALLAADGPLTEAELTARIAERVAGLKENGAHIHIPRDDPAYGVEVGLRMLRLRQVLKEEGGTVAFHPQEADLLRFYANSVPQLEGL